MLRRFCTSKVISNSKVMEARPVEMTKVLHKESAFSRIRSKFSWFVVGGSVGVLCSYSMFLANLDASTNEIQDALAGLKLDIMEENAILKKRIEQQSSK